MKIKELALLSAFCLTLNSVYATEVAVVDVHRVVSSSAQVQMLKQEQNNKAKDLMNFVEKAKKEVASVTDTKKKQALAEKYDREYLVKRENLEKDYAAKLRLIEESISEVVSREAKLKGYDMVVAKDVVLFSNGNDITEDIIKTLIQDSKKSSKKAKSKK